jgi:rsbT antagonist protein RsbS
MELTDGVIIDLKEDIAREIREYEPGGLVIEVSGVDAFDSFIARAMQELSGMARLMGVRTILAGLSAAMAITLVEMDMMLEGVETSHSLENALDKLGERARSALGKGKGKAAALAAEEVALLFGESGLS